MIIKKIISSYRRAGIGIFALALSACTTMPDPTLNAPCTVPQTLAAPGPEQVFATPEQAANKLADASRHNDKKTLLKILGPDGKQIISSGDAVADKDGRARFVAAYDSAHKLEDTDNSKKLLIVGEEEWPLPIPLVHVASGWQFDTEAGVQEILNRRIGRNELNVIKIARAYVEAQREYAETHHAPNGQSEYAQRFVSRAGKQDGLYWPVKAGEPESPFGPLIAHAQQENYIVGKNSRVKHQPFHGYYYKILTQQGPNAAGGAMDYMIAGHMVNGFAMIGYPAEYGNSGVMSFIVNQNGIVYERNLGPDTIQEVAQINQYDPDEDWNITGD